MAVFLQVWEKKKTKKKKDKNQKSERQISRMAGAIASNMVACSLPDMPAPAQWILCCLH